MFCYSRLFSNWHWKRGKNGHLKLNQWFSFPIRYIYYSVLYTDTTRFLKNSRSKQAGNFTKHRLWCLFSFHLAQFMGFVNCLSYVASKTYGSALSQVFIYLFIVGVFNETYMQAILRPEFLSDLENNTDQLSVWKRKYGERNPSQSLRDSVLEHVGRPIHALLR